MKCIRVIRKRQRNEGKFFYIWELWKCRIIYSFIKADKPLTVTEIARMWNSIEPQVSGEASSSDKQEAVRKETKIIQNENSKIKLRCEELVKLGILDSGGFGIFSLNYYGLTFCFLSYIQHLKVNDRTKRFEESIVLNDIISLSKIKDMALFLKTKYFRTAFFGFLDEKDISGIKQGTVGSLDEDGERVTPFLTDNIFYNLYDFFNKLLFNTVNPDIVDMTQLVFNPENMANVLKKEANISDKSLDTLKGLNDSIVPVEELRKALMVYNEVAKDKVRIKKYESIDNYLKDTLKELYRRKMIDKDSKISEGVTNFVKMLNVGLVKEEDIKEYLNPDDISKELKQRLGKIAKQF